jgi:putative transposase
MAIRKHPSHGVIFFQDKPTLILLTICTKDRRPWLACDEVHTLLREVWIESTAWLVGRYSVLPDHVHLFVAHNENFHPYIELDRWAIYVKSQFSKRHKNHDHRWQTDHWDRRLRSDENYDEKWGYVRSNAVRHGLVENADDWPYQGEIFELRWE